MSSRRVSCGISCVGETSCLFDLALRGNQTLDASGVGGVEVALRPSGQNGVDIVQDHVADGVPSAFHRRGPVG